MTTGQLIGDLMRRRGLTYRQLAEDTGLHVSSLHRMVHGKQQVSTTVLPLIARALKIAPARLLPVEEAA